MAHTGFGRLLSDTRVNAALAWSVCLLFLVTVVLGVLRDHLLWSLFAALVAVVVTLPAVAARNPRRMPPWEVVLLAGLPVIGRAVATVSVMGAVATYLSIAALALLVAVNLHLFTAVEMNLPFAVLFVVVTTLGTAGVWAVARWASDLYLGTALLLDPALTRSEIEEALMWEFVGSAAAGLVAGLVFEGYIRWRTDIETRTMGETA